MSDTQKPTLDPSPTTQREKPRSRFNTLHLEPLWWGLFSAGGVCVAVFVPAVVVVFGILWPFGAIELDPAQLVRWYQGFWGLVFTVLVICLPALHAAHRIRHGLYDLRISQGRGYTSYVCYGSAIAISALALIGWWLL